MTATRPPRFGVLDADNYSIDFYDTEPEAQAAARPERGDTVIRVYYIPADEAPSPSLPDDLFLAAAYQRTLALEADEISQPSRAQFLRADADALSDACEFLKKIL